MKYSKRELKSFNFFALFLFSVGALVFTIGAIDLAVHPKMQYVISQSRKQADLVHETVSTNLVAPARKYAKPSEDRVTVDGTNLWAVSNMLLGGVFMALSFSLNRVLLRVMRHNGEDVKSKLRLKKRQ